ncbi:MAG: EAL domain-containing protein, partial [Verrucomicrobia bacterium]|nr:EAL domain-containing protein [Verrucomicrobiota bacterium]
FRDKHKQWRWLDISGSILPASESRLLLVARDITLEKETEARLARMALCDALTDLGNRQQFNTELTSILDRHTSTGQDALMVIDVDDFKLINDTQGHVAGDNALRAVAQFLSALFIKPHSIYRIGGDEFCIILRNVNQTMAQSAGEKFVEAIHQCPIVVQDGSGMTVNLSAGIAMIEPFITAEELMSRADSALYAAKAAGKGRFVLYKSDSEKLVKIKSAGEWYARITEGLLQGRFALFYQPIIDFKNDRVLCSEVLLRYRAANGQIHLPGEFLPAAERYNLMQQLDRYVLGCALATLQQNPECRLAVNLSGPSVSDPEMHRFIHQSLKESGVSAGRLTFEITETTLITNLNQAGRLVEELRACGCGFALDDFGSGFSSLSYLRNLPVNLVKIYGGFVERISCSSVDLALLRSIHEIAHLLGKETVAEFVNSEATCALLKGIGVDHGQGFYLGKPSPLLPGSAEPMRAVA